MPPANETSKRPNLTIGQMINMSIGFFGIQHGFEIQFARMSSIYEKLGAAPSDIPLLWLAAPATGLILQPIVGYLSDKTWIPSLRARRRPYFFGGAILGTLALFAMPNSSSLWMAAGLLWVLDASLNITMEPFRAFVADKQNSQQRPTGYAMQSLMIGLGTIMGNYIASINLLEIYPALALHGQTSMHYSFYLCGVIFLLAVTYTVLSTPEDPPENLAELQKNKKQSLRAALQGWARETADCYWQMPAVMKRLALVQFFTWMGLFCMWMYYSVSVPYNVFGATDPHSSIYDEGIRFAALTTMARGIATPIFALLIPLLVGYLGRTWTHGLALMVAGVGLLVIPFIHTPQWLFVPMIAAGIGWASIVSMPYVILVEHLPAQRYGIFMGIFNMFIVLPEICVSLGLGSFIMELLGNNRSMGVAFGGLLLLIAAGLTLTMLSKYD